MTLIIKILDIAASILLMSALWFIMMMTVETHEFIKEIRDALVSEDQTNDQ